jgi:hypothetical protein
MPFSPKLFNRKTKKGAEDITKEDTPPPPPTSPNKVRTKIFLRSHEIWTSFTQTTHTHILIDKGGIPVYCRHLNVYKIFAKLRVKK